jgi:hypothetical protein
MSCRRREQEGARFCDGCGTPVGAPEVGRREERLETQLDTLNGNKLALGTADGWATAAVLEGIA